MTKKNPKLSATELEILKVLWERGACSVVQVGEDLAKTKGYSRTTIQRALLRLHQKLLVKRKRVDGLYRYQATKKRQQVMGVLLTEFIHKVFDGSHTDLVQQLAASMDVKPEELQEMRRIFEDTVAE